MTNGGTPVPAPQTVPFGGRAVRPADPSREGYAFVGWYAASDFSGSPWDFENGSVTGNMTLYARWEPLFFTVSFNAEGGAPTPPSQSVEYGGLVTRPADPSRDGYTFTGWYATPGLSIDPWDFDADTVTNDLTLHARWVLDAFTVAFVTNGGSPIPAAQTVVSGGLVTRPTDPIREDYVFVAWYDNAALTGIPWSFSTHTVSSNMTLYARWLNPV